MRLQDHGARTLPRTFIAILLAVTEATAQVPVIVDEAVDSVLYIDATGEPAGLESTTEASFGAPRPNQDGDSTTTLPSEGFFFSDDGPRAFWRSDNGRRIVHPLTAQNYQDDAYVTSDLRATYLHQQLPDNAVLDAGAVRIYDLQVRYAVNEALQLQISKAGYSDVQIRGNEEIGATDVALAVKYAFLQDWQSQTHASIGLGYELGLGDEDFYGDDELRVFGAFNQGFDRSHIGASVNALFATGSETDNGDSDRLSVHLHYDYEMTESFSPVVELNYYRTLSNGDPVTPYSGLDFASFGGNDDNDALSAAIGGEFRIQRDLALRLAYESPLSDNVDLWGYRWTASAVWRF